MARIAGLVALVAIAGCGKNRDFVGQDLGNNPNEAVDGTGGTGTGGSSPTNTDDWPVPVFGFNDSASVDYLTPSLTLDGQTGYITVDHTGVPGSCLSEWEVVANGTTSLGLIVVEYNEIIADTAAGPDCWWTLSYQLSQIPPGTWTVQVPGGLEDVADVR